MAKSKVEVKKNFKLRGLNKVLKGLKGNYYTKVGILGTKDNRASTGKEAASNAEIGVVQEFGSFKNNIPARSFLRMPLIEKRKELIAAAAKERRRLERGLVKGGVKQLFALIGLKAEEIIQKAFESGGFGKWQELKHRDGTPLIDTGQLRRSITSKVVKGGS